MLSFFNLDVILKASKLCKEFPTRDFKRNDPILDAPKLSPCHFYADGPRPLLKNTTRMAE